MAGSILVFLAALLRVGICAEEGFRGHMVFSDRLISGAGARGLAQTMLHPIDVMRTRLQAKGLTVTLNPQMFVKGLAPQFFLAFPAGALQFAAYEWSKAQASAVKLNGAAAEVMSGAVGALAASVIRVPQEVLKQRVQADIYPNALVGFKEIVTTKGLPEFYKGYLATISRDVPWNALSFMFFAQSKGLFKAIAGEKPGDKENLVLGALSGMTAAVIMTPVDVVKTRLMTGGASGGIIGTARAIVQDEGAAILMKGVLPRIAFLAPLAALTLTFYEVIAKQLVSRRLQVPASSL
eukprot:CAMPEP_0119298684 /NCGR_PEP_ID=MMETSP1333-20130426/850_1 /TAXON_ID=418940 /ORGANISM="Scyphosphaera apsteinii, Strain RCC1455" /LENGTH=293 /DNA_ID=CAMNT_0007299855 /DNA_START=8 /DNA_END=889 /DNA_ORIENTATION=-